MIPTPTEFTRMNRTDRLAALRRAQDVIGIDAPEYDKLARIHTFLVRWAGVQYVEEA
jgi:hypothetical protein